MTEKPHTDAPASPEVPRPGRDARCFTCDAPIAPLLWQRVSAFVWQGECSQGHRTTTLLYVDGTFPPDNDVTDEWSEEKDDMQQGRADLTPVTPAWALRLDPRMRKCRKCSQTIYWCVTTNGKKKMADVDGEEHQCPR